MYEIYQVLTSESIRNHLIRAVTASFLTSRFRSSVTKCNFSKTSSLKELITTGGYRV